METKRHDRILVTERKTERLIRGFIFACTDRSEAECLGRLLFGTEKAYGPIVIRIRQGDLLFLNNIETDVLHGVFRAVSNGSVDIEPDAFEGKYRYQVKVEPLGDIIGLGKAKRVLTNLGIKRNTPLYGKQLAYFLGLFLAQPVPSTDRTEVNENRSTILIKEQIDKIKREHSKPDIEEEIPLVESTTFWDFPKQSYGLTPKGNNKYAGVTPALIIYNMIWRYTEPGDLVVDPMCGSGTTVDVCREEKRRVIGYDISPAHPDVIRNDARAIPLEADSVDMVFIDSPYGDNVRYNDDPNNIGKISSESDEFYDELEKVMKESHRILREGKVLGWLIGDQWVRGEFTPVGFKIYDRLCKYFEPVDIICVNRRGQSSNTNVWHNRARRFNFYLRGFKYLIIARKPSAKKPPHRPRKIQWAHYERNR
jgi:DNA modification methylase